MDNILCANGHIGLFYTRYWNNEKENVTRYRKKKDEDKTMYWCPCPFSTIQNWRTDGLVKIIFMLFKLWIFGDTSHVYNQSRMTLSNISLTFYIIIFFVNLFYTLTHCGPFCLVVWNSFSLYRFWLAFRRSWFKSYH